MDERKKLDVVRMFEETAAPEQGQAGPKVSIKINGNNNITAGGDVHVNRRVVQRTEFTPGPEHITQPQAKRIKDLVDNLVAKEEAGGMPASRAYAKWYGVLKDRYQVTSYKAIPAHLGESAIKWLQQQSAVKRSKIRRVDKDQWRKEHYTAIWARASEVGMSKGEVYALVESKLGKQVTSLKQLGEQALKALYDLLMSRH